MFKVVVPLETPAAKDAPKVTGEVTDQLTEKGRQLLNGIT